MWIVKTAVDPDSGVIGLNGDFYILDYDENIMTFNTRQEAEYFIEENGGDPEDEYIDYVEVASLGNFVAELESR